MADPEVEMMDYILAELNWPVGNIIRVDPNTAILVDDDDVAYKVTVAYDEEHTAPSQR